MDTFSLDNLLTFINDPSALLIPQNLIVAIAIVMLAVFGLRLFFGMARFIFLLICLVLVGVISAGVTYLFTEFMNSSGFLLQ
ncbi:MAG: hypothetical protein KDE50_05925 [Caldilineaceae bacterium]|nr:hypothetical protein [Caldilineaceae bacterium]MCB0139431.1 hypothetical protein [Caldilineaceae bacterium]